MEKETFRGEVMAFVKMRPKGWRKGQAVFNYIDANYGNVARKVQFEKGIDCFYNDETIHDFIDACYELIY